MIKPPPIWHAEVRKLRASGVDPREIAKRMGRDITSIRWVLDENGERENARQRARRARGAIVEKVQAAAEKAPTAKVDTLAIARLFAAGVIDRVELSRRLRGEGANGAGA